MALYRDEIFAEVIRKSKRADLAADLGDILNNQLRDLSQARFPDGIPIPWEDLKTSNKTALSDGDYYISLPSDLIAVYMLPVLLWDTDSHQRLKKKSRDWFSIFYGDLETNTSSKNKPSFFCIDKDKLYLAPKSDGTDSQQVELFYTVLHPEIDSNADEILFSDKFKNCLVYGCLEELFDDNDDEKKAAKYKSRKDGEILSLSLTERRNIKAPMIIQYRDF